MRSGALGEEWGAGQVWPTPFEPVDPSTSDGGHAALAYDRRRETVS